MPRGLFSLVTHGLLVERRENYTAGTVTIQQVSKLDPRLSDIFWLPSSIVGPRVVFLCCLPDYAPELPRLLCHILATRI